MRDPRLGRRYAEALFGAARDAGKTDEVVSAMFDVIEPLKDDPTFLAFWRGRRVPLPRKLEIIDELFKEIEVTVRQFLKLLLEKGREEILFDVFPALRVINDREKGIVRAVLTTAVELDEAELEPFRALLAERLGGKIVLTHKVDKTLVAGFTLRFADKVIDGSVARSISEIRRRLSA